MRTGTSLSEAWTLAGAALRKSTHFSLRRLGVAALMLLMLCVAGEVSSQTLSGERLQLHEGELVSSSAASLSNVLGTLRVERSTLGGLAPGRSTGLSGLQLEGSVVAVPEPASGLQGVVAALGLGLLAWRRGVQG